MARFEARFHLITSFYNWASNADVGDKGGREERRPDNPQPASFISFVKFKETWDAARPTAQAIYHAYCGICRWHWWVSLSWDYSLWTLLYNM